MSEKRPFLTLESLLLYSALGFYAFRQRQKGQLAGNDIMVRIDQEKVFNLAEKHLKINPAQRQMLEGVYNLVTEKLK